MVGLHHRCIPYREQVTWGGEGGGRCGPLAFRETGPTRCRLCDALKSHRTKFGFRFESLRSQTEVDRSSPLATCAKSAATKAFPLQSPAGITDKSRFNIAFRLMLEQCNNRIRNGGEIGWRALVEFAPLLFEIPAQDSATAAAQGLESTAGVMSVVSSSRRARS